MKHRVILVGILFSIIFIFSSNAQQDDFPVLKGPYLGQKPPGLVPEIFAPGIISTDEFKEFGCTFSSDLSEFYFTRGSMTTHQNTIMVCKLKNGQWTKPVPASFSGQYYDDEPHICPDNSMLFFGSERPKPVVEERKYGLWMAMRMGEKWKEPVYYGPGMCVTSSMDKSIYYSLRSDTGDWVILRDRFSDGKYCKPELLKGNVNSPYYDAHPCIAPDEKFLIFDSKRPGAIGGKNDLDLYICFREAGGKWSKAIHMGDKINTPLQECVASLSPDGKYIFFARGENDQWSIYWVDAKIIEEFKPKEIK